MFTISSLPTTGPEPGLTTRVVVSVTLSGCGWTLTVGAVVSLPPVTVILSRGEPLPSLPLPQAVRVRAAARTAAPRAWIRRGCTVGAFDRGRTSAHHNHGG